MNIQVVLDDWIENPKAGEDGSMGRNASASRVLQPWSTVGMDAISKLHSRNKNKTFSNSREELQTSDVLFSRYRHLLSVVAYRVLGNHEEAEHAVQNCLLAVSGNVPRFDHEGAFRSWLVRVLIDEAVMVLDQRRHSTREKWSL